MHNMIYSAHSKMVSYKPIRKPNGRGAQHLEDLSHAGRKALRIIGLCYAYTMRGNRHRTWANAHNREWQQKKQRYKRKRQFAAAKVYALAALLFVGTFCAVFFWPKVGRVTEASLPTAAAGTFECHVSSITDGDTLRCLDGTRVRLHAVAAREKDESCSPGHPCPSASGAAATAMLSQLAAGQTLQCERTGTTYNRVAAICRNEANTEINCAMVQSGTTLIWPRFNAERSICN